MRERVALSAWARADSRGICTSDYIDTADEDWPDRLHMSQMQHVQSNSYTRKRIERAHDGLWARGAAVGNTVIGYKRRPTLPATEVSEWLDSIKFAKAKWSRQAKWTAGNVNAIIRRTTYRGFETFRKKKAKRKLRTGKSEYVWNDEDKIQTRESPHLRIVSDHLWYRANEVVDKRRVFQKPVRGAGHPLRGTTRRQELVIVRARRREVDEQAGRKEKLPSEAKLLEHLGAVQGRLFGDEARAAVILRQLPRGPILMVPFM